MFVFRLVFGKIPIPVTLFMFESYNEDMLRRMLLIALRRRYSDDVEFIVLRRVSISDTFLFSSLPAKHIIIRRERFEKEDS